MSGFTPASQIAVTAETTTVSTGSGELDALIGGIAGGVFYLFYGEEELVEELFPRLMVTSLTPRNHNHSPRVVYGVCGNYRVERNIIDVEPLMRMLESAGLIPEEALKTSQNSDRLIR